MSAVTDYINKLQSYEEYSFSWKELINNCKVTEPTIRKEVIHLMKRKEIINIRKGFYIILPPRYRDLGKLPVQLYVDKLFCYLEKPYYIALYSATALYGASHQQVQQDYVVTVPPALLTIKKQNVIVRFFKTTHWPKKNIVKKKSDAGTFNVSSPALTAIDLIHYQRSIGGLNRMLANLEELVEEIKPDDIYDLLTWYPYKSSLQRFGYLLDQLEVGDYLTNLVYQYLQKESFYTVLLSPTTNQKPGSSGNRWKIDVNLKMGSDL